MSSSENCRPVHRLTLAEQLQKTLRIEKKGGFGSLLGKIAKSALSGVAVYVAVNVLAGKAGQKRLRQDFAIVTVLPIFPLHHAFLSVAKY